MEYIYDFENKLVEAVSKNVKSNSLRVKLAVIKNLMKQKVNLTEEYLLQEESIRTKFEKEKYKPIFEKRSKVINGELKPVYDESKKEYQFTKSNEKGIDMFWGTVLGNNEMFRCIINDKDREILENLKDIKVEQQDGLDYTLNFCFAPNKYFDHTNLYKTYRFNNQNKCTVITSTNIQWKNLDVQKKESTKDKKQKKIKNLGEGSFFSFFTSKNLEEEEKRLVEEGECEAELAKEEAENIMVDDLEKGDEVREMVIPKALKLFVDIQDECNEEDENDYSCES